MGAHERPLFNKLLWSLKLHQFISFSFGEEKLAAPLIATPNVDNAK
jgi:hypothetical protein